MKKVILVLMAVMLFAWGAPAKAEQGPFERLGAACGKEIEALCPKVVIGGGRILACLEKNKAKLSKGCEEARAAAQKAI